MAKAPFSPYGARRRYYWKVFALLVAFYTIVPFLMSGRLTEFFFPYEEGQLKMVLADAQVTEITKSRQQFTYYLDNEFESYDFNGYVSADPARRTEMNENLGYNPSDLGHYLRLHDRLTKAAGSPLITVRRGSIVTQWLLYSATPEGKVPPKERPFITYGDSVATP